MTAAQDFKLNQPLVSRMLCLEASAGTGKTYTIEGLVTRLIAEEGLPIDALLVVTFTRAATSELKTRVRAVLQEARDGLEAKLAGLEINEKAHKVVPILLENLPDEAAQAQAVTRLNLAIACFDEAQISTIHGFCKSALQEHAFDSGAPFDVELVNSIGPLCKEIAQDWWAKYRFDTDRDFLTHLENRKVDLKVLETLVSEVAKNPDAPIYPAPSTDQDIAQAKQRWIDEVDTLRKAWVTHREDVLTFLNDCKFLNQPYSKEELVAAAGEALDDWLDSDAPYPGAMAEVAYFAHQAVQEKIKTKNKAPVVPSVDHPFFDIAQAFVQGQCWGIAWMDQRINANLHALCAHTLVAISDHHDAHRSMAFNDLLRTLKARLTGDEQSEALKAALRGRYQVALIDEFQDTDPIQWGIFEALFAVDQQRLIVVGDPKQAIYAFRGADIATYMRARQHPEMLTQTLGTNHRSDAPVVRAVQELFKRDAVQSPFLCDIDYPKVKASHTEARFWTKDDPAPGLVISLVRRESVGHSAVDDDGKPTGIASWGFGKQVPAIIAAQVAGFLADPPELVDKDTDVRRSARAADVAVLVRGNKQAREMQQALRSYNISSTLRGDKSVLTSDESKELLQLLEAVLESTRSGPAKQAISTQLLGQDFSTLAELQLDELRWSAWMARLRGWRTLWFDKGFASFARALTNTKLPVRGEEDQTIPTRLLRWRDGERRMTNLLHLLELLQEVSLTSQLTPTALVAWLRAEMASDAKETAEERRQLRLESDQNAVTIATIHKSKGLQYPIVWCPYMWSAYGTKPRKLPLRFRDDQEQWCLDISLDEHDPGRQKHTLRAAQTDQEESLRLLYVALTRARHQVHLLHAPVKNLGLSPLGHLLHPGVEGPETLSDDELRDALDQLVTTSEASIAVNDLSVLPKAEVLERIDLSQMTPTAKARKRRSKDIDTLWRRASFSGLVKSKGYADDEDQQTSYAEREDGVDRDPLSEAPDEALPEEEGQDSDAEDAEVTMPPEMTEDVLLKDFKGGTQAGSCIHKVYELHDFQKGIDTLKPIVSKQLSDFRFDAELWTDAVSDNIQASLEAPIGEEIGRTLNLPADFCLAHLSQAQRFDELDFVFPLHADGDGRVPAKAIGECMARNPGPGMPKGYPEQLQALGFMPARGFMIGSIDLVFEHQGRWYVVDYKSNTLGSRGAHYTKPYMDAAMSHSHYVLQYHIYCVALHRLLDLRLPNYAPETHLGGVLYLFMRGMSPGHTPGTGCFFDAPPSALIKELSDLLGGDGGQA